MAATYTVLKEEVLQVLQAKRTLLNILSRHVLDLAQILKKLFVLDSTSPAMLVSHSMNFEFVRRSGNGYYVKNVKHSLRVGSFLHCPADDVTT